MKKFLNALGIIFLFILIFGIIGKSLDFDELDKNDDPNSDDPIVNPGDIIGPGTNNPSVESRIAVPNSGYVNKVYFDTSLSVEEVKSLFLDNAPSIAPSEINSYMYYLSIFSNGGLMILEDEGYYAIGYQGMEGGVNIYWSDGYNGLVGWNEDFDGSLTINDTLVNEMDGLPSGIYNDKLIDLFYTYPSELIKEEVTTLGTPVPNTGYVNKVYFDTSLSVEEVVDIIESSNLIYDDSLMSNCNTYCLLGNPDVNLLLIVELNGNYAIADAFYNIYFSSAIVDGLTTFVGWNEDFNGVFEFNFNALSELSEEQFVGSQNDKLIDLIYTYPSELKTLGTTVLNTGVLENLYINTNLSVDEVIKIISSLPYTSRNDTNTEFGMYVVACSTDEDFTLEIGTDGTEYIISEPNNYGVIFATSGWGFGYNGWNPEFTEEDFHNLNITLKDTYADSSGTYNVGTYNIMLSSLFSTTPFN